jgi:hypothetical protein
LLPRTRSGIPSMAGFSRRMWSSSFATGKASLSAESTMKLECCEQRCFGKLLTGDENLHDRIHAAAVPFPHRSEPRLATEIPALNVSAAVLMRRRMCIIALGRRTT